MISGDCTGRVGCRDSIKKSWGWCVWWRLSNQKFCVLQFLPLTSSKQLNENPCINTQCCLTPLSCILLNAPLGTRSTWHATAILNTTVRNIWLDFIEASWRYLLADQCVNHVDRRGFRCLVWIAVFLALWQSVAAGFPCGLSGFIRVFLREVTASCWQQRSPQWGYW